MIEWGDMKNWWVWLWVVALLPPFSLGGVNSTWLVELGAVIGGVWLGWEKKDELGEFLSQKTVWWFLGWMAIISLSGVGVLYWPSFWKMWGKWVIGLVWLWIVMATYRQGKERQVWWGLIIVLWLKLVLEVGLYQDWFKSFEFRFLDTKLVNSIKANLLRERTIISFFNEPLALGSWWLIAKKNKRWKWWGWLSLLGSGIVVFMSNWRGRMVVWLMVLLGGIGWWGDKKQMKKWLVGIAIVGLVFGGLDRLMLISRGYSVLDRLRNEDKAEDKNTLKWRKKAFGEAREMASYTWFGVGVGQFYNFTDLKNRLGLQLIKLDDASKYGPHNIFFQFLAETGWIGWFWLVLGLSWFGWWDSSHWKIYNSDLKLLAGVFWLTVAVVQFYPAISWEFVALFFGLRGVLLKGAKLSDGKVD